MTGRGDRAAARRALAARATDNDPRRTCYLVFTTNEEIGGVGGSYASATLPGTLTLAVDWLTDRLWTSGPPSGSTRPPSDRRSDYRATATRCVRCTTTSPID